MFSQAFQKIGVHLKFDNHCDLKHREKNREVRNMREKLKDLESEWRKSHRKRKQISGEYTIKYIISENVLKPNKDIELYI